MCMRQQCNFSSGDNGSRIAIISILWRIYIVYEIPWNGRSCLTAQRIIEFEHGAVNGYDDFRQFVLHACIYWQFIRINEWYEIPLNMQATAHTHTSVYCSSGCCCCCGSDGRLFSFHSIRAHRIPNSMESASRTRAQNPHCSLHINFSFLR